jgi:hypothetical protein
MDETQETQRPEEGHGDDQQVDNMGFDKPMTLGAR